MPGRPKKKQSRHMSPTAPTTADPLERAGIQLPDHSAAELLAIWEANHCEAALNEHLADLRDAAIITEDVLMAVVQS